jgi:hypothetical protein
MVVCATALPNTNVDATTAEINFINVSVKDWHSLEAANRLAPQYTLQDAGSASVRKKIIQGSRISSRTDAQSAVPMRLHVG